MIVKNSIAIKFIKPKANMVSIKGPQLTAQEMPSFVPACKLNLTPTDVFVVKASSWFRTIHDRNLIFEN